MDNRFGGKPQVSEGPTSGQELSPRELDVAGLLIEGHSNKIIGAMLGISEHTTKFHLDRIMKKLGVTSRVAAAVKHARWLDSQQLQPAEAVA